MTPIQKLAAAYAVLFFALQRVFSGGWARAGARPEHVYDY